MRMGWQKEWISTHAQDFENQQVLNLAICLRDGLLIGAIGLMPELEHRRAGNRLLGGYGVLGPRVLHRGRTGCDAVWI